MKIKELIGFIAGGACLGAAIAILASNGGRGVIARGNVHYFVMEVGKTASELHEGERNLGQIAQVWAKEGR